MTTSYFALTFALPIIAITLLLAPLLWPAIGIIYLIRMTPTT